MSLKSVDWSVYVVTDRATSGERGVLDEVRAAIRGGASVVQLRDKDVSVREAYGLGRALHEITRAAGIPLIVNDRIDLALALEAEGVHVGQSDLPATVTRQIVGPDMIVGVSTTNLEESVQAVRDGADYLGTGDVFGTPSKADACPPIGVEALAEIVRAVDIPVVAIGGIKLSNVAEAVRTGVAGLAVISAVFGTPDPEAAARSLRNAIEQTRKTKER